MDGRLTADPELRFTPSGAAVCDFTVAGNDRRRNKQTNEWEDGPATFLRCSAWNDMAENIAESLRKGDEVLVTGRIAQREWEKDGIKRTTHEVSVDTIGPSLRWRGARLAERQRVRTKQADDPWATGGSAPARLPYPWANIPIDEPPY